MPPPTIYPQSDCLRPQAPLHYLGEMSLKLSYKPFLTASKEAISEIAAGRPVIVTDDESRENEGDLIVAASKITPEVVNMMIQHARRGLI